MAFDYYLQLSDIRGECRRHRHEDEIDVISWSLGFARGDDGQVIRTLSLFKFIDASSPLILALLCRSEPVDALLTVHRAGGRQELLARLTFGGAIVIDLTLNGSRDEDVLTESLTLSFTRLKFEVQPLDLSGTPLDIVEYGFDTADSRLTHD